MKRILILLLSLLAVLSLTACDAVLGTTATTAATTERPTEPPTTEAPVLLPYTIVTEVTDYVVLNVSYIDAGGTSRTGNIVVRLDAEKAPITAANFQKLVGEKFYDGLIFHRIIENFMIQGGGYDLNGTEKDADSIKGEFSSNGYDNDIKHERGVISMARTNVKDSASSQFFIMHKAAPHLDGEYAAFGYTVYGLDVLDAIATQATNYYDMPIYPVIINYARFVTPNSVK